MDIPKTYDPKQAEERHYAMWEAQGCFAPEINRDPDAPVYSIVIPPPNVTGSLHMGHALQHTLMDVLTRFKRMSGYRTLWVPGEDHAGISTQIVVERELKKEGISRHEIGREKFLERVWKWRHESGSRIMQQMRREGASVDWSRQRFTMDEGLSRAVNEFFVRCYEEDLIYHGEGMINWCPKDQTALSDLEVDKEAQAGKLYYLRYPIKGTKNHITVATTRPETMLGDTAVAVNPDDARYDRVVGARILLPLTDREIKIVADDFVDPSFGTGAVKVTPAHDPNDYQMGLRHELPLVKVIDQHARMTAEAGAEFAGLDRYEAREKVVARFEELGLLERVVDYEFSISKCGRCRTVVEPLISLQWFCRQAELARRPLELIREQREPRFVPENPYEKVYTNWLENLHDWTLSRQLWWGHRIPAWYDEHGNTYVARSEEEAKQKAKDEAIKRQLAMGGWQAGLIEEPKLTQDPDVLDTWFSSALWPISTLGWPDDTEDLRTFYPTSVLITARDIIFLWVSRMMMTGVHFMGEKAFEDVFITGTVFDKHGQRMSKMKNNGVDPLEMFERYGVDATRLVLASIETTDTRWNEKQVESYRNFANKIWNAARFCLLNSEGAEVGRGFEAARESWAVHDRWIVSRLNRTAQTVNDAIEKYQFHHAVQTLYHFFWDDFCDWYIELTKADVTAAEESDARAAARCRVLTVLEQALRLLHPFMPFITEELWQLLPGMNEEVNTSVALSMSGDEGSVTHRPGGVAEKFLHPAYAGAKPTIMLAAYPQGQAELIDERAEAEVQALIELVSRVRNIRSEMNIKPGESVPLVVSAQDATSRSVFEAGAAQIARLVRASNVTVAENLDRAPRASARAVLAGGAEVAVPLEGLIDFAQERERLRREQEKLSKEAERLESQLANENFVARAPAEKVTELRQRLSDIGQRTSALRQSMEAFAE